MNINRTFRSVNKSVLIVCFLFSAIMLLKSYPALSEPVKSLIGIENCQEYPKAVIEHNIDSKKQITEQAGNKLHENVTYKEKKRSEPRRCGNFLSKRSIVGKNDSGEKPKIPQLYENDPKDDNQNTPPLILSRGPEFLGLLNKDPKKLAQDYIVNKLNSQITNNTQKWLSQFGTAKINLNVDHHGHLDESSVDLLVPFYDDKDHWLVYSQYGYRHKDSRDTVNLGVGTRLFINDWMYGANTFYDNDLTGNNSRFSLGGELWTNYLKMSANAYFRLSNWHNSRDLTNYYERPANGYDLIADMYLPSMPSLGAKIKYEQYFGDNVALFGTNNRQKDPYAATIGVNYTPIPLITAGVDYKLGKEGKSDGIFSFNVNYRFGVPLSEQLSPENVSSLRSLAGSRYDLVERNNNIILNYLKKQQHFRLLVPVIEISSYGGEVKPIQIQSDTPFKNVTWDIPELFQKNGGMINIESTHGYTIQLPEYQPDGKNDYTITGTSKDDQLRVQIQAHVLQRNISLSVNTTDPLIADGNAKYVYTATLLGADKKTPIENAKLIWDTDKKDPGLKLKPDSEATDKNGQQTATLTSTTPLSDIQVSVSINGERVTTDKKVSFTESSSSYRVSSVTVEVDKDKKRYNNGTDSYIFTATVKDGHGNLVVGQPIDIDWQTDPKADGLKLTKQSSPVSNAQGQVTATLTSTAAVKDVQVSAKTAAQQTAVNANGKVSFTEFSTSYYVTGVTVEVDKDKKRYNNGSDSYTFTATVVDGHGNLVVGKPIDIDWQTDAKADGLKLTKQSSPMSNAQGQVTATLTSTAAVKDVQVSAKAAANPSWVKADSPVSFEELSSSYQVTGVTVEVDKDKKRYNNGADSYTFTATVVDAHGRPVADKPIEIDWQTDPKVEGLTLTKQSNSVSNAQGQVTATLTSTAAVKDVQVSAKTAANQSWVKADSPVSFEELSHSYRVTGVTVEVDKDKEHYNNGSDSYTFTATVKDGHGNLVVGKPVDIDWQTDPKVEGLTLTKQSSPMSNAQGQVTATLTSTAAVTGVRVSAKTAANQSWVKADSPVSFEELSTSYYVASVTVDVDKDKAHYNNGSDSYTFTATVKDGHGNLVVGQPIDIDWQTDPTVDGLKLTKQSSPMSNAQGQVTATLTSTAAVTGVRVSAKTAANQSWVKADSPVSFEELSHSYRVTGVTVEVDKDKEHYNNGSDSYTFTATVKDGHGNLVVGKPVDIDWQTDAKVNGLKLTKQNNSVSNAQGQVTATLTSTVAVSDVQVSAKTATQQTAENANEKVSFTEYSASYYVASVTVDVDKDKAHYNNGSDSYTFTATVKDGHGNLVVGKPVDIDWQTDSKADGLKLTKQSDSVSNAQGQVTATLTSTVAVSDVQVSAKAAANPSWVDADQKVSFEELSHSYRVTGVTVEVDKDKVRYNNGSDSYTFTATVKDGHGNLVVGKPVDIDWQTDSKADGLKLTKQSNSVSNAQGQVTATLTSTAKVSDVQVSAKAAANPSWVDADQKVSFEELSHSYRVTGVTVEVDKDKKRYNNGSDSYTFTATVVDAHGRPVADKPIEIDWQTDSKADGLKLTKQSNSVSNAQGQVTATLTSTAKVSDVQVSAKAAANPSWVDADQKVSFEELSHSYRVTGVTVEVDKDKKRYNNGTDSYTFTATVVDAHGRPVADKPIEIDWQTDPKVEGLTLTKQNNSVSNAQGQVTATLTSTAKVSDVQVSAKAAANSSWVNADRKVSFEELSTSYHVTHVTVDKDGPLYNGGTDTYTFTATVEDAYGNLVADKPIDIDWQTDPTVDGLKLTKQSNSVSNAQGQVTATLTSTVVAIDVQVSAKTATQQTPVNVDKKVSFISPDELASLTVSPDHVTEGEGAEHTYTFTATVKDFSGQAKSGVAVAWSATNSKGVTIADENLVTQVVGDGKTDADGKAQYQIYSKSGGFVAVMVTAKVNDSSVGSKNKTVEIKANEQDVANFFILDYQHKDGESLGRSVPKERMNFGWKGMMFKPEYLSRESHMADYNEVYDSSNKSVVDVEALQGDFSVKKAGTATLTATFTHSISGRYLKYVIPNVKIDHFVIIDDSSYIGAGIGYVSSLQTRIDESLPLPICTRGNRIKESDLGGSIDYLVNNLDLDLIQKGLLGDPIDGLSSDGIRMGGLQVNNKKIQAHLLNNSNLKTMAYVVLCEE
ncbi:Ig-like domain-containing protein [Photorhabdus bodei]|uniref:Ig-like domain-containing protein n=1 Tax=Photorhabdus bodei TaxID=2029681 RepID=UPI0011BD94D9|nr:Ig-like domain-containing protein [Photorhabdus bodei]